MSPWLATLSWWACTGAPGPAATYVRLAGAEDPGACLALDTPELQGECQAFAAWAQVDRQGAEVARQSCRDMAPGIWRDECFFRLADQISATGALGRELCAEAGGFRDYCLAHGMGREAQAVLAGSPIGAEAEAFVAVERIAVEWVGERLGPSRARGIFRAALAARTPQDAPFDPASCGSAPTSICQEVYVQLVVDAGGREQGWAPNGLIRLACGGPQDLASIAALGLPTWVPGAEPFAAQAWQRICLRKRAGTIPGPNAADGGR